MTGEEMLSVLLGSEIRGDLLTLFHRNPGLIDTIDGVARRIGRTSTSIEEDIRELVQIGVLKEKKIGNSEAYLLDRKRDKQILDDVASHLNTIPSRIAK